MCRLTAYLGEPLPVSVAVFGGEHSLFRQSWAPRELLTGSTNADGWGAVWYGSNGPLRLSRAEPIWYAHELEPMLEASQSSAILAALRNATQGLPIGPEAVAPFTLGRWAFVLNGFVPSFRSRHMRGLRQSLPDHLYGELRGVSDAETLFLMAVAAAESGRSLARALEAVVQRVSERLAASDEECQLTMTLTDGTGLAVVRTSNSDRVNSLYRCSRAGLVPNGVLFASEALDESDSWSPVPAHTIVGIGPEGEDAIRVTW